MKSIVTLIIAGIAASSLLAALAIAQPARYTVYDLGAFGGTSSAAYGVNYSGRVGGAASFPAVAETSPGAGSAIMLERATTG